MNKIKYLSNIIILSSFLVGIITLPSFSYEKLDHYKINKYIAENTIQDFSFDDYLISYLGLQRGREEIIGRLQWISFHGYELHLGMTEDLLVYKCLANGGRYEDSPFILRSVHHFHNPLKSWLEAGFKGGFYSSILWAQFDNQSYGKYGWEDVRSYFYEALTATDPDEQAEKFVDTFEGLGRQLHLIQDASAPLHTRDDGHYFHNYEEYVKDIGDDASVSAQDKYTGWLSDETRYAYDESVLELDQDPLAPVPIARIIDTDQYDGSNPDVTLEDVIGLAEYSNANFFSKDTIFKTDAFPFPNKDSVGQPEDMQIPDPRDPTRTVTRQFYIKIQHGDIGYRLCTVPVYDEWTTMDAMLDDNVYEDYAQRLIPRAVCNSGGLLKYFFRGTIDIDSYSVSDAVEEEGARIIFSARNTSGGEDGIEEMSDGSIELVIHYRPSDDNYQYRVLPEANNVRSIQRESTELIFDLGDNPPPVFSEKCSFYLVYRGELGLEEDAVCVGYAQNMNNIEITLPETGVYALQGDEPEYPESHGFNRIKLLARNVSVDGEEMPYGSIEVVVQYRVSDDDPFARHTSYPNPANHRIRYSTAHSDIHFIPRDSPIEIDFDLGNDEIPLWAYDIRLYVVYRGETMLDDELVDEYSQVVGFKDISEPTPITIVNHTDKVKLFGQWYDTGLDALAVVDNAENGGNENGYGDEHTVFPRTFENIYVRLSPDDGITRLASSNAGQHNCCIPRITAGHYVTFYVLSDYVFNFSGSWFNALRTTDLDMMTSYYRQTLYTAQAFRKQVVFNEITGRNTFYTPYYWRNRGSDFCGYLMNYCLSGYPGFPQIYGAELYSQQPVILDEYND